MTRKHKRLGAKVPGSYLGRWRAERKLTQGDVAKRTGSARVSIAYWENFAELPEEFVLKMDRAYGSSWRESAEMDERYDPSELLRQLIAKVEALDRDVRRALD